MPSSTLPKLTIGMAVYDDFDGLYMTVQSLCLYHADVLKDCELIVVDNNPGSSQGRRSRSLIENWIRVGERFGHGARYIAHPGNNSTSKPRNMVFEYAKAPYVLVCDPHVMFPRLQGDTATSVTFSPFTRLIGWFDAHPDSFNILHGPMIYDDLQGYSSHMDDVFRGEMWGTWGTDPRGNPFGPEALFRDPFEIPAHGLGMWACRREAWITVGGFHHLQRGFGGEEWYIHEKFRKYGTEHGVDARTLCAPWLPWLHRFNDAATIKYPLKRVDKLRNYILEFNELGMPLDRVYNHFVKGLCDDGSLKDFVVTQEQWDSLVADPETYPVKVIGDHGVVKNTAMFESIPMQETPDAQRMEIKPILKPIPTGVFQSIAPFLAKEQGFLLLAYPDFTPDRVTLDYAPHLSQLPTKAEFKAASGREGIGNVIIHNATTAIDLLPALNLAADISVRFLTITNCSIDRYGEQGQPRISNGIKTGNPGLLPGIRRFCQENPQWTVLHSDMSGIGVLILGCRPDDKPKLPSMLTMAANYGKALAAHALAQATGGDNVTDETYKTRLSICSLCPHRTGVEGERCSACGCNLLDKAAWESSFCPLGKWDDPTLVKLGAVAIEIAEAPIIPITEAPKPPQKCCGQ